MSQRLGIAAALLGKPKYLLLDEPANGLDPEGIHWLRKFLKDYAAAGNAVFVSSHLLSEMALMADNLVVIGKGKLITTGSVSELTNAASGTGVYIRSPKLPQLEKILKNKFEVSLLTGGLKVSGASTDEIGALAFSSGIPLHELTAQTVSLEDAFLEITADSQEYHANSKTPKGEK